jgi:hypothetical protein
MISLYLSRILLGRLFACPSPTVWLVPFFLSSQHQPATAYAPPVPLKHSRLQLTLITALPSKFAVRDTPSLSRATRPRTDSVTSVRATRSRPRLAQWPALLYLRLVALVALSSKHHQHQVIAYVRCAWRAHFPLAMDLLSVRLVCLPWASSSRCQARPAACH